MLKSKSKIYIGTSGWVYRDWEGRFYPEDLASKNKLKYFSQHLKTVEVNYSFYRLPRPSTYQKWYSETPDDFIFAVKASRFITHIKRLKGVKSAWKLFLKNALNLNPVRDSKYKEKAQKEQTPLEVSRSEKKHKENKPLTGQIFYPVRKSKISNGASGIKEKLGPILFQFPPSFKATEENIKRLEKFIRYITTTSFYNITTPRKVRCGNIRCHNGHISWELRFAFEFRHKTWFTPLDPVRNKFLTGLDNKNLMGCDEKIYKLLKKYNCAWVIADSPRYPRADVVTADFVYIRMHAPYINFQRLRRFCSENTGSCITGHGSKILFGSKYTKKELKNLAQKIKKWQKQKLDIYVYFNNDFQGYAVENARELIRFCE